MALIKKLLVAGVIVAIAAVGSFSWWAKQPLTTAGPALEFTVNPGSGAAAAAQQIAGAGVPLNRYLFALLARVTGQAGKIKAGS